METPLALAFQFNSLGLETTAFGPAGWDFQVRWQTDWSMR